MGNNKEYYIEETEGNGFNLWVKQDNKYHNLATLFYKDAFCQDNWSVSELKKSVSYTDEEIIDELENPLVKIKIGDAETLLNMKNKFPTEIFTYFKLNISNENDKTKI